MSRVCFKPITWYIECTTWGHFFCVKVNNDHRSKFSNLSNRKEEAWKNPGFNRIRTRDLRDTGAMLYQLGYEVTHWEQGHQLIEFISSREEWNDVKYIWNNSHLNCGCRWNRSSNTNVFIYTSHFFCLASWLFRFTWCSFTTCLSSRGKLTARLSAIELSAWSLFVRWR